jgi:hypothetical protein
MMLLFHIAIIPAVFSNHESGQSGYSSYSISESKSCSSENGHTVCYAEKTVCENGICTTTRVGEDNQIDA